MDEAEIIKIAKRRMHSWPECCMKGMKYHGHRQEEHKIVVFFKCEICYQERDIDINI